MRWHNGKKEWDIAYILHTVLLSASCPPLAQTCNNIFSADTHDIIVVVYVQSELLCIPHWLFWQRFVLLCPQLRLPSCIWQPLKESLFDTIVGYQLVVSPACLSSLLLWHYLFLDKFFFLALPDESSPRPERSLSDKVKWLFRPHSFISSFLYFFAIDLHCRDERLDSEDGFKNRHSVLVCVQHST